MRRTIPGEPAGITLEPLHGVEQRLASVILGGVLCLMAFPAMLLIHVLADTHFRGIDRVGAVLIAVGGYCGGLLGMASLILGLIFGITGIMAARQQRRPIALGLAGVLLCSLALFMWLGIAVLWTAAVASH
jgi:hypothetical protein